jgi:uncharacterized protein with HEPN domain
MKKNILVYIDDILESIDYIISDVENLTLKNFESDRHLRESIIYRFMIIGEASSKIDLGMRKSKENIPWKKIIGMRNILIHDYEGADLEIIFDTAKEHLSETRSLFAQWKKELS